MSPLTLRRYLLDGQPATWWDFAAVNEPEVMDDLAALEPGQSTILGMCDHVERLPDAPAPRLQAAPISAALGIMYPRPTTPARLAFSLHPALDGWMSVRFFVGGLYVPTGLWARADLDDAQRAQVHAATSVDELRALPFVLG